MGEVYRARDTRLDRDVALKILPDAFAADTDRVARFECEAKMLAALNHPNIAQIHGLEQSGSTSALVVSRKRPRERLQSSTWRPGTQAM
jgi:serine/threonine protein kinase